MQQDANTPWEYKPDSNAAAAGPGIPNDPNPQPAHNHTAKDVSWEAAEFIEHHHGAGWYAALTGTTALLAALVYFATKDIFATAVIVIVGVIIWIFAGQKPSVAKYQITTSGLSINGKIYNFGNYKSFTVVREGSLSSVNLFPLKRLMPPLSAYFDNKDEQKIIEAIGNHLPYENHRLDNVDRLARRLRL